MKSYRVILSLIMFFLMLSVCAPGWSAEDKTVDLQKQVSKLEEQKTQLEAEKVKLVAESDKLSLKIDALKIQAKSGLGIIGRYKLSRSLRKAQGLSGKTYDLEKRLRETESELKIRKKELEEEYERQIALLMENLSEVTGTEERGQILKKVKEYQAAKEKLAAPKEKKLEHLDITQIEIQEYDGPREIREKADLINDFAAKMKNRIDMLNTRSEKLGVELKTRERLGEFAEEISFFGERFSREEIVSDAGEEIDEKPDEIPVDEPVLEGADTKTLRGTEDAVITEIGERPLTADPLEADPPAMANAQARTVVERNGVSVSFAATSLEQIKKQIELLGDQEESLKKELAVLMEKANSFYKKADEIEKSETQKSGKKGD